MTAHPAGRTARRFLERLLDLRARGLQRRNQAKDQTRQARDAKGERDHQTVDPNLVQSRKIGRPVGDEGIDAPPGEEQSGGAAEKREKRSLDEELPARSENDSLPARFESQSRVRASGRAREKKVGDIGAGDQEDKSDRRRSE